MVISENIHTSNIIQTEQAVFRNICVYNTHTYIYVYVITMEKEAMDFKESKEGYIGGFIRRT